MQKSLLECFTVVLYGTKPSSKLTLKQFKYKAFERGSVISPYKAELLSHLKSAAFVSNVWVNVDIPEIVQHPTHANGWNFIISSYLTIMYEGKQLLTNFRLK